MSPSQLQPLRRAVTLLLLAGCTTACAPVHAEFSKASPAQDSRLISIAATLPDGAVASAESPEAGVMAEDRYFKIQAKKGKTGAQAAVTIPCDLWGPFRWEVSAGLYDEKVIAKTDGAIFGTELDGRGPFPPTEFYGISAQVINGGLNAFAFTHNSSSSIGSLFFADATEIDFAIEYDGSSLMFLARETGSMAYSTVATFPLANQPNPLNPAIGVFNFGDKGAVGFDNYRVVNNGVSPIMLTAEQEASRLIWEAIHDFVEVLHVADGVPDFAAAATLLDSGSMKLQAARDAVALLDVNNSQKKAKKQLKKASKKIADAVDLVEKAKKAGKAINFVKGAIDAMMGASLKVYPLQ